MNEIREEPSEEPSDDKRTPGIIIISPSFLDKRRPQRELAGLGARELAGGTNEILPIGMTLTAPPRLSDARRSPPVAARSHEGIAGLVRKILAQHR